MRERIDFITPILIHFIPKLELGALRPIYFYDILSLLIRQGIDVSDDADETIPLIVLGASIQPKDDRVVVNLDYSCKSGIKQAYVEFDKDVYSEYLSQRHKLILSSYLWINGIEI